MEAKNEKMQGMFTEDPELKNTHREMNNTLEGLNSRITEAEQINDLKESIVEITVTEQNTEKQNEMNEDGPRDLWDNGKCTDIRTVRVPEGEDRKHLRNYLKRK